MPLKQTIIASVRREIHSMQWQTADDPGRLGLEAQDQASSRQFQSFYCPASSLSPQVSSTLSIFRIYDSLSLLSNINTNIAKGDLHFYYCLRWQAYDLVLPSAKTRLCFHVDAAEVECSASDTNSFSEHRADGCKENQLLAAIFCVAIN